MKETELKPDALALLLKFITNYRIKVEIKRLDFEGGFSFTFERHGFYTGKIVRDWEIERYPDTLPYIFKKMVHELLKHEDEAKEAVIKIETSGITVDLKGGAE